MSKTNLDIWFCSIPYPPNGFVRDRGEWFIASGLAEGSVWARELEVISSISQASGSWGVFEEPGTKGSLEIECSGIQYRFKPTSWFWDSVTRAIEWAADIEIKHLGITSLLGA